MLLTKDPKFESLSNISKHATLYSGELLIFLQTPKSQGHPLPGVRGFFVLDAISGYCLCSQHENTPCCSDKDPHEKKFNFEFIIYIITSFNYWISIHLRLPSFLIFSWLLRSLPFSRFLPSPYAFYLYSFSMHVQTSIILPN